MAVSNPRDSRGRFRPKRRNVDGFIGKDGKFHPIRGTKGYSEQRGDIRRMIVRRSPRRRRK